MARDVDTDIRGCVNLNLASNDGSRTCLLMLMGSTSVHMHWFLPEAIENKAAEPIFMLKIRTSLFVLTPSIT
jgi:hypothetical protein